MNKVRRASESFGCNLQAMYDHDVIEEEVLLDWGKKVSKKHVSKETAAEIHAKAQPFLKWLQEAEEEETTEEEEDDGDVEVSVEGGGLSGGREDSQGRGGGGCKGEMKRKERICK